jgi:hypothetical protein
MRNLCRKKPKHDSNDRRDRIAYIEQPRHFPFAFSPPSDFKETPNRLADFATDSGVRASAFATASSDFPEAASATKRRSCANDFP